jgi:aerobic-type carbon monoxide dehydrogenase small subunit (CoxS/CutS family)
VSTLVSLKPILASHFPSPLELVSPKEGCSRGVCGSCTVMVSSYNPQTNKIVHRAVNSCLTPVCDVNGKAVITVEGLGSVRNGLHPIQVITRKCYLTFQATFSRCACQPVRILHSWNGTSLLYSPRISGAGLNLPRHFPIGLCSDRFPQVMAFYALLRTNPTPTSQEIVDHMDGEEKDRKERRRRGSGVTKVQLFCFNFLFSYLTR